MSDEQVCLQFTSPVCTTEGDSYGIEESAWPFGASGGLTQPQPAAASTRAIASSVTRERQAGEAEMPTCAALGDDVAHATSASAAELSAGGRGHVRDTSPNAPFQLSQGPGQELSRGASKNQNGGAGKYMKAGLATKAGGCHMLKLTIPDAGAMHAEEGVGCMDTKDGTPAMSKTSSPGGSVGLFAVHLLVTAIAEGKILSDLTPKVLAVLEQVRRKVSKEQNTVVHVAHEGPVDLKMRVFVANSVEAKAVWDYITTHPNQVPAAVLCCSRACLPRV